MLLGAHNGYVFSGGQLHYSQIVLEDSAGIMFDGFNYGGSVQIQIRVKGGKMALFSNSLFSDMPKVIAEDNACVKFKNCFTRDGEEITGSC